MKITRIGLDTAKHVFQVHGVDEYGKAVIRQAGEPEQGVGVLRQPRASLVGLEACAGAHQWARELKNHRHEVCPA